ncbi:hypothetical protein BGX38DRAFT_1213994 [Terfezia claveryi]|nr:hypothetical protein BGX38DRAFT_1213994 [Terfezia claveryi]
MKELIPSDDMGCQLVSVIVSALVICMSVEHFLASVCGSGAAFAVRLWNPSLFEESEWPSAAK